MHWKEAITELEWRLMVINQRQVTDGDRLQTVDLKTYGSAMALASRVMLLSGCTTLYEKCSV